MAISEFYERRRNHMRLISGHNNGGQYLRLMAISTTEILGTIPLATFYIHQNVKMGITPWTGWANMHRHYSAVEQVAGFTWKNDPQLALALEMFRWSLVACAFIFFALFGLSVEARENYYRLYKSLTRRIRTSSSAPDGAPHAYVFHSRCFSVLIYWGSCYLFLQYSISPFCEETRKRWRHGSYPSQVPNGSEGQLEFERPTHTHRPIFGPVHFYGNHS
jgi:hypothetical protein